VQRLRTWQLFAGCVLIWGTTWHAITYQLSDLAPEFGVAVRYVIAGGSSGYFRKGEHVALNPEYRISKLVMNVMEYFGFDDQMLGEASAVDGDTDGPLTEVRA